MQRLTPSQYDRAASLVRRGAPRSHMALVHAVLEGRQEGALFVDDPAAPRTLLVSPVSGFCFLFGDATSGCFERFLPEYLARHLPDQAILLAMSSEWETTLDHLFARKVRRKGFELDAHEGAPPVPTSALPAGFTLQPMDAGVLDVWQEGLDPWVIRIWGGPERFAARSFGFGVMREGRIASFCTACGIGGGEAEVEIGTVPAFQRRGLAFAAATAFLAECRRRGLRPAWSCGSGNGASDALARRLGFVEVEDLAGYPLERDFRLIHGRWGG